MFLLIKFNGERLFTKLTNPCCSKRTVTEYFSAINQTYTNIHAQLYIDYIYYFTFLGIKEKLKLLSSYITVLL